MIAFYGNEAPTQFGSKFGKRFFCCGESETERGALSAAFLVLYPSAGSETRTMRIERRAFKILSVHRMTSPRAQADYLEDLNQSLPLGECFLFSALLHRLARQQAR